MQECTPVFAGHELRPLRQGAPQVACGQHLLANPSDLRSFRQGGSWLGMAWRFLWRCRDPSRLPRNQAR